MKCVFVLHPHSNLYNLSTFCCKVLVHRFTATRVLQAMVEQTGDTEIISFGLNRFFLCFNFFCPTSCFRFTYISFLSMPEMEFQSTRQLYMHVCLSGEAKSTTIKSIPPISVHFSTFAGNSLALSFKWSVRNVAQTSPIFAAATVSTDFHRIDNCVCEENGNNMKSLPGYTPPDI